MVNLYFCGKEIRVYDSNKSDLSTGKYSPPPLKKWKIKITNYIIHKQNAPHDSEKTHEEYKD